MGICEEEEMGYTLAQQIQNTIDEIDRLKAVMKEINAICRIPSNGRHAYTHFQSDFDKIRKLTSS